MAQPGWYPDPGGSGRPRYWDGRAWAPMPEEQQSGRDPRRTALVTVVAGSLAIMLVVALLVWQPWRSAPWVTVAEDTNSARPTGRQWDELPPPQTPPSEMPTDDAGRPVACPLVDEGDQPPVGEWYVSGGVAYRGVPGWSDGGGWTIDFTSERSGQLQSVASGWVAITAIGKVSREDFSDDPRGAATQLVDCMSTSYYYSTLDTRERLQDEAFATQDGVRGWIIRENFWNVPDTAVSGDEVVVVVLDAGDPEHLVLFHTQAPIEQEDRKAEVARALESLRRY